MAIKDQDKVITFHIPADFSHEHFFIPDYQRGYRWTKQEVMDLLDDLKEFRRNHPESSYSMQPIVVRKKDNDKWEVIDGQQRLTTILLILQALGEFEYYTIEYAVLDKSNEHISKINDCPADSLDDINLWHMKEAYDTSRSWLDTNMHNDDERNDFKKYILSRLKFLWYRTDLVDNDEVSGEKIFQRLNIGKIELTQSELIKALFLSDDLYTSLAVNRKQEVASQWDEYEAFLHNDEFWYFLTNEKGQDGPNRIEFLLRTLVNIHPQCFDKKSLSDESLNSKDGLFRAYYEIYLSNKDKMLPLWDKAIDFMDITRMWYEDVTLYHLIGFRIYEKENLHKIITDWNSMTVPEFRKELAADIAVRNPLDTGKVYGYRTKSGNWQDKKSEAKNLLLLANILHVLRQNISHESNPRYAQGIFYKFPFNLFKKQIKKKGMGWDVEHIASATDNDLESIKDQQDWVCSAYMSLSEAQRDKFLKKYNTEVLNTFFKSSGEDELAVDFKALHETLTKLLHLDQAHSMTQEDKNKISNFALLDYSTNRMYKNAIFPTKRQHIRNKEIGILETVVWSKEAKAFVTIEESAGSAFVPPCTKDAFMKCFSSVVSDSLHWSDQDAKGYADYLDTLFRWFKEFNWAFIR